MFLVFFRGGGGARGKCPPRQKGGQEIKRIKREKSFLAFYSRDMG